MINASTSSSQFRREGKMKSLYGPEVPPILSRVLKAHMPVEGKRVMVLGSQKPWLEALLLEHGARSGII